jgi:hypothetical protein
MQDVNNYHKGWGYHWASWCGCVELRGRRTRFGLSSGVLILSSDRLGLDYGHPNSFPGLYTPFVL